MATTWSGFVAGAAPAREPDARAQSDCCQDQADAATAPGARSVRGDQATHERTSGAASTNGEHRWAAAHVTMLQRRGLTLSSGAMRPGARRRHHATVTRSFRLRSSGDRINARALPDHRAARRRRHGRSLPRRRHAAGPRRRHQGPAARGAGRSRAAGALHDRGARGVGAALAAHRHHLRHRRSRTAWCTSPWSTSRARRCRRAWRAGRWCPSTEASTSPRRWPTRSPRRTSAASCTATSRAPT